MKTFSFLRHHKANLLLALVLLMIQAYSELTLPSIMSGIVDTGISRGGIESVVPDEITVDDLSDLELFLTPDEVSQVSSAYGAADDAGVRSFIGSEDDRRALEGFLGQAEMLVFQLDKGIASDQLLESMGTDAATALGARPLAEGGAPSGSGDPSSDAPDAQAAAGQLPSVMGETIDMKDIRTLVQVGVMSVDELVAARGSLMDALGDSGETIVTSQAIEFVKRAYENAGIDLGAV